MALYGPMGLYSLLYGPVWP